MSLSKHTHLRGILLAAATCLAAGPVAQAEDAAKTATLPEAGVSLGITPVWRGPWRMTLSNDGPAPVRILADARLLWFEVVTAPEPSVPGKKPTKAQAFIRGKIPVCRPPSELRPENEFEQRALILRPGERYTEEFDPMLLCGAGKLMAGLKQGAVVYPHYGYLPPPKKPTNKKADPAALPPAPYVLDSISEPRAVMPARQLEAPGLVVSDYEPPHPPADEPTPPTSSGAPPAASSGAPPTNAPHGAPTASSVAPASSGAPTAASSGASAPPAPPPLVDERAPRLKLTATPFADAHDRSNIAVTVTLKNEGLRPALIHFRNDNIGFLVRTPTGQTTRCSQSDHSRGAVRDFFETMRPGARKSVTLRLHEICPVDLFERPGIYHVNAFADLHESGDAFRLPALVSHADAESETRLRIRTGSLPYQTHPAAVDAKPEAPKDDAKPEAPKDQ